MDEAWCEGLSNEIWDELDLSKKYGLCGYTDEDTDNAFWQTVMIIKTYLTDEYEVRTWLEAHGYEKPVKK